MVTIVPRHSKPIRPASATPDSNDTRHTAAVVLLLLGVSDRTVMSLIGRSKSAMTDLYQNLVAAIRRKVAGQIWSHALPHFNLWPHRRIVGHFAYKRVVDFREVYLMAPYQRLQLA